MKLTALALLTSLAAAGYALPQTPAPSSPAPSAPAPADSPATPASKIDRSCRKEIIDLCGHAHGQEMRECVKAGLHMNKFSASCKSEIDAQKDKS
ncbi:MAG TPA: hypothetical protein VMT66_03970 [Steroidobacteraceae bacterium]|nr:hypothetical protein [Steroidobacteraceae bacterium]